MFVHFTLAHSDLRILDFCKIVIPFHPEGVTFSVGVHKCTYLSRYVTAVIWVLYLFDELRVYVWLRLSVSHNPETVACRNVTQFLI
jgi:hypothetical protein